ncbi:hypothetical protein UPYG_G00179590 [Umbra pygmaea]|uniref:Uncharacterized protein n=1 Tax=Umbra pygmaea TaxID=75934 RepID=A0ABD0WUV6_UMBPY
MTPSTLPTPQTEVALISKQGSRKLTIEGSNSSFAITSFTITGIIGTNSRPHHRNEKYVCNSTLEAYLIEANTAACRKRQHIQVQV